MTASPVPYLPAVDRTERDSFLNREYGLLSWLLTRDHKRIAILYMISITGFFMVGGVAAMLMRLNLMSYDSPLMRLEWYNRLFTLHGVVMVWFFLIPSIPTTIGNFFFPLMIGARDLAFPRLNLLSWYLFMLGGAITLFAVLFGGLDTGWTFYTPLSTNSNYTHTYVTIAVLGIFINGFSSILTGLNFIVTLHTMRAPGMRWSRLPLFCWSLYSTSIILVLATPVLAITLLLLVLERTLGVGIFDPQLGGDPILFQHFFWFYSHPAVYIMILPGFGVVSEIIACFSRKRPFGYEFIAGASVAIAFLGFLVWGHHMFVSGQGMFGGMIFSLLSFLIAIPSAVKVFNWTATLYKGSTLLSTPMLYALSFIGLFTIGGLTGLFLACLATDIHLTDTYFIVAHFHYIMVGGMATAYLGAIHFWWPKMTGRMYPEWWGRVAAVTIFLGFNLTFFPQFVLGAQGMPRRYGSYPPQFEWLNVMSTAGASIMAVGYFLPMVYLLWSLRWGKSAPDNPWPAMGLEWTVPSPPPKHNFDQVPIVKQEAYAYHLMWPQGADAPLSLAEPSTRPVVSPEMMP